MPDSHPPDDRRGRKAELRARLLAARRSMDGRVSQAASVQATLLTLLSRLGPATGSARGFGPVVAAYTPLRTEPGGRDLPAVLAAALAPTGRLILPVLCDDRDLDWVAYDTPADARLGREAIGNAALVVVPAVAVDRRGVRLGRGGGSYDRALARVRPEVPVVALLHDGELLDEELPEEPHDRRVTAVITPSLGLVRMSAVGWTAASGTVHH